MPAAAKAKTVLIFPMFTGSFSGPAGAASRSGAARNAGKASEREQGERTRSRFGPEWKSVSGHQGARMR